MPECFFFLIFKLEKFTIFNDSFLNKHIEKNSSVPNYYFECQSIFLVVIMIIYRTKSSFIEKYEQFAVKIKM